MSTHESTATAASLPRTTTPSARAGGTLPFVLGSVVLGTIGIFLHQSGADPLTATWFRCAFGLLGLSLWAICRRQLGSLFPARKTLLAVLVAGALMVLAWGLFFAAIERTSAGVATVLFHVQPLWVLLLGGLCLKEPIARRRMACVAIAMLGLVLATGILEHLSLFGAQQAYPAGYWWGVGFCLVGALCTACVTLVARTLQQVPAGILAWWQCAMGTLVLLAWPILHGWPPLGAAWGWLAGLGLLHTGLAYALLYAGMARLDTDRIAVYQFIYPAVAIVIDWLVYGQHLGPLQLGGIAIMAMAIGYAERAE